MEKFKSRWKAAIAHDGDDGDDGKRINASRLVMINSMGTVLYTDCMARCFIDIVYNTSAFPSTLFLGNLEEEVLRLASRLRKCALQLTRLCASLPAD